MLRFTLRFTKFILCYMKLNASTMFMIEISAESQFESTQKTTHATTQLTTGAFCTQQAVTELWKEMGEPPLLVAVANSTVNDCATHYKLDAGRGWYCTGMLTDICRQPPKCPFLVALTTGLPT